MPGEVGFEQLRRRLCRKSKTAPEIDEGLQDSQRSSSPPKLRWKFSSSSLISLYSHQALVGKSKSRNWISKIPRSTNRRKFQRCLLVCRMCYAYHLISPYCKPHTHRRSLNANANRGSRLFQISFFSSPIQKKKSTFCGFSSSVFTPRTIVDRNPLVQPGPRTVFFFIKSNYFRKKSEISLMVYGTIIHRENGSTKYFSSSLFHGF